VLGPNILTNNVLDNEISRTHDFVTTVFITTIICPDIINRVSPTYGFDSYVFLNTEIINEYVPTGYITVYVYIYCMFQTYADICINKFMEHNQFMTLFGNVLHEFCHLDMWWNLYIRC